MFEPLNISVSDSISVHSSATARVVGGTAVMGVDASMSMMSVAPEMHPHDLQRRQPLEGVESFSVAGVIVTYAVANRVQRWRARYRLQAGADE